MVLWQLTTLLIESTQRPNSREELLSSPRVVLWLKWIDRPVLDSLCSCMCSMNKDKRQSAAGTFCQLHIYMQNTLMMLGYMASWGVFQPHLFYKPMKMALKLHYKTTPSIPQQAFISLEWWFLLNSLAGEFLKLLGTKLSPSLPWQVTNAGETTLEQEQAVALTVPDFATLSSRWALLTP